MINIDLVCFGELLWDMLPNGKVAGGAPFNIVNRANALGLQSYVISSVGKDELGNQILNVVRQLGNSTNYIQRHSNLPTSVVHINVGENGEPEYDIVHPVAWDDIAITEEVIELTEHSKAFIYSSLAIRDDRSRQSLFKLLPYASLKVCDVNLRDGHFNKATILEMIATANILRMNEHELDVIGEWHKFADPDRKALIKKLVELYGYTMVIVTLGGEGAICYHQEKWYEQRVFEVKVQDTVGSGDAFLAGFINRYLKKDNIASCLKFACAIGALTASKRGGTPGIKEEEIATLMQSSR